MRPDQPWRVGDVWLLKGWGDDEYDDDNEDDDDEDEYYIYDEEDDNDDDDDNDYLPPGATPAFTRFHLARRFWNQIFTCAPIMMTMKIRITIIMTIES